MDRRLLILALGMFALGSDSFVVAGILPHIARTFGVEVGTAGQFTTVYALAYAVLSPTVAALAHAVPRKQLMLAGLATFVVANLATAIAPSFVPAIVARAVAGLGAAMYAPTATSAATLIVPARQRGRALSLVIAGLTSATALGAPIGTLIGGLGDWRYTMLFVSLVGVAAAIGVGLLLQDVPMPRAVTLQQRLAPLGDPRVAWTVLTTLLAMGGTFVVYTYFAVVFDRILFGSPIVLVALLVLWGLAGTAANLFGGRLVDRIGTQKVLLSTVAVLVVTMAVMPFAGHAFWLGAAAIVVYGASGWAVQAPQQHRLSSIDPAIAPVLLGLNTTGTQIGVSLAGIAGAAGIGIAGAHDLPFIGAAIAAGALVTGVLSQRALAAAAGAPREGRAKQAA